MTLKETKGKFLKENWMLYSDWIPIDGGKMKRKENKERKSLLDMVISLSYSAGMERALEIMRKDRGKKSGKK